MRTRSAVTTTDVLIGATIALTLVVAAVAVLQVDPFAQQGGNLAPATDEGLEKLRKIDPKLIQYEQTGQIPVAMQEVRALATGPDDRLYVAGDKAIHVFDADGEKRAEISLTGRPTCLTVGGRGHAFPGRTYVGVDRHVEVFDAQGEPESVWKDLGVKALLTSLAVAEHDVFLADAGNKIVWHYDTSGKLQSRIGQRDRRRKIPGFVIPSPYFDIGMGPDGLLRVANPGALRIEAYTFDGDLEQTWMKRTAALEGFFGCCNPIHIALSPEGRMVTAEKGVPRVKVYGLDGKFLCVVAGPEQLDVVAADLAVDARNRVLVLDPKARSIRIFEHQQTPSPTEP